MPSLNLSEFSQYFRSSMVAFFLKRTLLNERLARNMLGWTHCGFSVDLTVKIPASSSKTREALAQYIARPPVSLQKILVQEHAAASCIAQSTIRTSPHGFQAVPRDRVPCRGLAAPS